MTTLVAWPSCLSSSGELTLGCTSMERAEKVQTTLNTFRELVFHFGLFKTADALSYSVSELTTTANTTV